MLKWSVIDCTEELNDGKKRERDESQIDTIVIHRVGKDHKTKANLGDTGPEIARKFLHDPAIAKYTGGQNPYTFYIGADGTIWQALPVDEVGNHARAWNKRGIGIACIGDFREVSPPNAQFEACFNLCEYLLKCLGLKHAAVGGHSEFGATATNSPRKECPGRMFDLPFLRHELALVVPYNLSGTERIALKMKTRSVDRGIKWE
jgi:N-acetyl-anhydromuramyl-L-alanine amidase AmpD